MRIEDWLKAATEDAARRGLPELASLLESLAHSTEALRDADRQQRAAATDADAATGHLSTEEAR
jgi:hypothetical protein